MSKMTLEKLKEKANKFQVSLKVKHTYYLKLSSAVSLVDNIKKILFDNNLSDMRVGSSTQDHVWVEYFTDQAESVIREEIARKIAGKRKLRKLHGSVEDLLARIRELENENELLRLGE